MLWPSDTCLYSLSFFTVKSAGDFPWVILSTLSSMITDFQNNFIHLRHFIHLGSAYCLFFSFGSLYDRNTNLPVHILYFIPLGPVFCIVSCHSNSLWMQLQWDLYRFLASVVKVMNQMMQFLLYLCLAFWQISSRVQDFDFFQNVFMSSDWQY